MAGRVRPPVMEGAAEFCWDWLVEDDKRPLVTVAGCSPELEFLHLDANGAEQRAGIPMGPAMDLAMVRERFGNRIRVASSKAN